MGELSQVRTPSRTATISAAVLGAAVVGALLAGCGSEPTANAGRAGAGAAPQGSGFDAAAAAAVFTKFDEVNSAAAVAGDVDALAQQELRPSLDISVAAARSAKAKNRVQPGFQHVDPVFAIPQGEPSCFVAEATLRVSGGELTRQDVSHFTRGADGTWRISHNVLLSKDVPAGSLKLGQQPAKPSDQAVPAERRTALADEVFARTIGTAAAGQSQILPNRQLDQQLAAGWAVYQQQLGQQGVQVTRTLRGAQWSPCAAVTAQGAVLFVALDVMDTLSPAPGGPATVTLPAGSHDLLSVGRTDAATGTRIDVPRTETFLMLVPDAGPATVLGLNDAATDVQAT